MLESRSFSGHCSEVRTDQGILLVPSRPRLSAPRSPYGVPHSSRSTSRIDLSALTERRVLVVDDDPAILRMLTRSLRNGGFQVREADGGATALALLELESIDVCVTDHKLGDTDGVSLLESLRAIDPTISVIVVSGYIDVAETVRALRAGAEDVLLKPLDLSLLETAIERGLARTELHRSRRLLDSQVTDSYGILDESPAMQRAVRILQHAAVRDVPIMFIGEPGTGKRALAELAHQLSPRATQPFVAVELRALDDDAAAAAIAGGLRRLRDASPHRLAAGTLFLDDLQGVGPLVSHLLAGILDPRAGVTQGVDPIAVRFLAGSCLDARQLSEPAGSGAGIIQRLSLVTIQVPTLHERGADSIAALASRIVSRLRLESDGGPSILTEGAKRWLAGVSWPRNVPQLRRVLEEAFERARGDTTIDVSHLVSSLMEHGLHVDGGSTPPGEWTLAAMERRHIRAVLDMTGHHLTRAAQTLGISRTTLYKKIAEYGLEGDST